MHLDINNEVNVNFTPSWAQVKRRQIWNIMKCMHAALKKPQNSTYVYLHGHIYVYIQVYVHTFMFACVCTCLYVSIYMRRTIRQESHMTWLKDERKHWFCAKPNGLRWLTCVVCFFSFCCKIIPTQRNRVSRLDHWPKVLRKPVSTLWENLYTTAIRLIIPPKACRGPPWELVLQIMKGKDKILSICLI